MKVEDIKNIIKREIEDNEKQMNSEEFKEYLIDLNHCVKECALNILRKRN